MQRRNDHHKEKHESHQLMKRIDASSMVRYKTKATLSLPKEILIVDDEPGALMTVQFLAWNNRDTMSSSSNSVEDALFLIHKYGKQIYVELDIMLPGNDGYEVCEIVRLNANYRDVKIVFLTAKRRERSNCPIVWRTRTSGLYYETCFE